jgi:diacylglycerol kinase family enzyme
VNPRSGDGTAARTGLADRARELGIGVIVLDGRRDLSALAEEEVSRGADVLGMAGGDGSLAAVAAVALAHELPFVAVPAGTRNHFARDLGLDPDDPVGALGAYTDGVEGRIDVGRVNGRLFLNNVSLGLYGEAVQRSAYRDEKVRVLAQTAAEMLGPSGAATGLLLADDAGREHRDPLVVLVSNNPYALGRSPARGRPRLDGGRLGVIVLDEPGRAPVAGRAWTARRVEVRAPATLHAGLDGEAAELEPPLELEIIPTGLRVRAARTAADGA